MVGPTAVGARVEGGLVRPRKVALGLSVAEADPAVVVADGADKAYWASQRSATRS